MGVDPAEQMILEAARLNPQAIFKVGFAVSLPLPDESADIVVSSLSFHHWEDHQKGIQEIARVLRPEGLLCLADHNMLLAKLWREKVQSRKEIQTFMGEAGLIVRRSQGLGLRFRPYHIGAKMRSECVYPVIESCKKLLHGRNKIYLLKEKFGMLPMWATGLDLNFSSLCLRSRLKAK